MNVSTERRQRVQQYLESARKISSPSDVIFEPPEGTDVLSLGSSHAEATTSVPRLSSKSLNFLPFEQREREIRRLALEHHQKEIQCGHVQNGCRTKEYQPHELVEVNNRLFGISRPLP